MQKADILIRGCTIIPMNRFGCIEDGTIVIRKDRIVFVGESKSAHGFKAETVIDADEKAALPGLINSHTHVPMTVFRGIAEDQPLDCWLKQSIWPLEAKLEPRDVYDGALLGCLEMIQSGTTCFADMYFKEGMVARAAVKSGLRATLAEGIVETGDQTRDRVMFEKAEAFTRRLSRSRETRLNAMFGPHSVYSCSQSLLANIAEQASQMQVGITIHVAESKEMSEDLCKKYDLTEVELLERHDFLSNRVLAAHCINLSEKDMHILSVHGVNVAYVPVANMKLGLGAARIKDLVDLKVNVCLGTDGPASNNSLDMFETMKVGALLQKLVYRDPSVLSAYEVLRMATVNGAKALGLQDAVGTLEADKKADIILLNLSSPHLKPLHDLFASVVYSVRGSDVDTMIVDGRILMENRQVKTLDEHTVMDKAEKTAFDLKSR